MNAYLVIGRACAVGLCRSPYLPYLRTVLESQPHVTFWAQFRFSWVFPAQLWQQVI